MTEPLEARLLKVDSDPIGCGLSNNSYRNPDGPEAAALIASLEAENARLRRSRIEHDCRFTMGNVADSGGSHCPLDNPCQRCRLEWLEDVCAWLDYHADNQDMNHAVYRVEAAIKAREALWNVSETPPLSDTSQAAISEIKAEMGNG